LGTALPTFLAKVLDVLVCSFSDPKRTVLAARQYLSNQLSHRSRSQISQRSGSVSFQLAAEW